MKDFFVTLAGVLVGSMLFILTLGSPTNTVSLKSQTGVVMKGMVQQMNRISP